MRMRRAQSGKSSKSRTLPTRTTSGGGGPQRSGLHLPATLQHAAACGPPQAPHPALPALPKSSPSRRSGRAVCPHKSRPSRAPAPPPPASSTRRGTSW
eukprot:6002339-Prymnesium_polylepis.1